MSIKVVDKYLKGFISQSELDAEWKKIPEIVEVIKNKTGAGNDFLGWVDLPENYDRKEFEAIKKAAEKIRKQSEALLVIGIGGSYLGARAAIEFLKSPYYNQMTKGAPEIYFIGNSFSGDDLADVLAICEGKDISVNVISKSGTTTESAIAFRIIRDVLSKKYSAEEIRDRVYVTTDKARGALKGLADKEGYETFVVPDDIGGRFSVLTPVGLLPIAVCGANIDALMDGALSFKKEYDANVVNEATKYAVIRNVLLKKGKDVELLCSYEPALRMFTEWWKQLYGESEGKDGKGIFPASVIFSTDLHSLGQYIQDGQRKLFETVLKQGEANLDVKVPFNEADFDGLNYIADETLHNVNEKAYLGTMLAHTDGGAPNLIIEYTKRDEKTLGELIYFFCIACAVSGYMLEVNPFNQPGVESYKKNMFALLGKPGYEEMKAELLDKLSKQ
ncbi:MAG: glucose-6-phosphate isomerase [Ruminococcaceae bacterium]|nr:glucose-6-phosphate isomerase [Oscillospiraceae bacterium]